MIACKGSCLCNGCEVVWVVCPKWNLCGNKGKIWICRKILSNHFTLCFCFNASKSQPKIMWNESNSCSYVNQFEFTEKFCQITLPFVFKYIKAKIRLNQKLWEMKAIWITEKLCQITLLFTVWKIHDFSSTQILCEISFGDSRRAKSAILPHLEALNFDFFEILHFLKAEYYPNKKIQSPKKWQKWHFFRTSKSYKIDFT